MSGLATSVIPLLSQWEKYTSEHPEGDVPGFARWVLPQQPAQEPKPPAPPPPPPPAPTPLPRPSNPSPPKHPSLPPLRRPHHPPSRQRPTPVCSSTASTASSACAQN